MAPPVNTLKNDNQHVLTSKLLIDLFKERKQRITLKKKIKKNNNNTLPKDLYSRKDMKLRDL